MKTAIAIMVFCVTAAAWGGEVEEYYQESNEYQIVFDSGSVTVIPDDILSILRECLDYIEDSSVIYNDPSDRANYLTESTLAIYELRSAQTDADEAAQAAQEQADRMRERAERYRRETALHHRIVEMIKKLEPKEKKK